MTRLLALLAIAGALCAQTVTLDMTTPAPPAVNASAFVVGNGGISSYEYYVVTRYASGSAVSTPALVQFAATTLSASNYVTVNWNSQPGALTYDVIRVAPGVSFNGVNCTSCAVATGLTVTTRNDQGSALTTYAGVSPAQTGIGSLYVNTRDFDRPEVRQTINGVDYQASLLRGSTIPTYCTPGDSFFKTNAPAGQNLYLCTSQNTFVRASTGAAASMYFGGIMLTGASGFTLYGSGLAIGTTDLGTVPAGKRWLTTVAAAYNSSVGNITYAYQLKSGGNYYRLSTDVTLATLAASTGTTLSFVAEAGESIAVVTTTTAGLNVQIGIVEYDATSRLHSARLLGAATGANTLYTVPAGYSATILSASVSPSGGGNVIVVGDAGGARTATLNIVPPGGSVATTNQITGAAAIAASTRVALVVPYALRAGASIRAAMSTGDATQLLFATVSEVAIP